MPQTSRRQRVLRSLRHEMYASILFESSSSESDEGLLELKLPAVDKLTNRLLQKWNDNLITSHYSGDMFTPESSSKSEASACNEDDYPTPETMVELYFVMYHTRYFVARNINSKSIEFRQQFFHGLHHNLFRQLTRMNKATFFYLLQLVEAHPIFANNSNRSQAPIEHQLAVCLDRLGHDGNGACINHLIPTWGISIGSVCNFSTRCFYALEEVLVDMIAFPGPVERAVILEEFSKRGFPGCVGLIDGTLLNLSQRPHISGESYFTRKSKYSMNVQVVCDHRQKITHLFFGMPGSCSDITCTKKSPIWSYITDIRGNELFDEDQYILGDSGYQCMPHLVCAFKKIDAGSQKEDFNTCVAKCRVTNEHCIGVLKSRWHLLKELRVQLKQRRNTIIWMLRWITLCGNLHNFVINQNDEWTDADVAADTDHFSQSEPQDPPANVPNVTGPDLGTVGTRMLAAAGNRLLVRIMDGALHHHRQPGGFLAPMT